MSGKEQEAIAWLRENLNHKGEIFVGFSGGKDSIVTAKLVELSGIPHKLYHSLTGIDAPEVTRFIRKNYPECKFLMPSRSFWHSITTRNPPANFSRWCCTTLKKDPSKHVPIKHRIMGQRKEESTRRGKYPRVNYFKKTGQTHYYPILEWNEADIWEFIERHNLEYPSLYDEGFSRIGCVICPFHSSKDGKGQEMYEKRWPRHFKLFEKYVQLWINKRKSQGKEPQYDKASDFVRDWKLGKARWYKKD